MTTSANATTGAVVARLFLPDDANIAGNVHGGTTLKLMEEAGMIAATRYAAACSDAVDDGESEGHDRASVMAALVRFEHMAFHQPSFVGEVGSCACEIVFASERSICVEATVSCENISKGSTRVTNAGWLWYVPMAPSAGATSDDGKKRERSWRPVRVSPMATPEGGGVASRKYEKAKAMYERRKDSPSRNGGDEADGSDDAGFDAFERQCAAMPSDDGRTPAQSAQTLCQMVMPGNCGAGNIAFGGFIMKLMDNAAGCAAFRHCRTNVVTVAISDLDFVSPVRLGDLCTIRGKVVFASSKSLDIEVVASVASVASLGETGDTTVAKGLFTFVSIGQDGRAQNVPALRPQDGEDVRKAYAGKMRYEAAKRARAGGKKN